MPQLLRSVNKSNNRVFHYIDGRRASKFQYETVRATALMLDSLLTIELPKVRRHYSHARNVLTTPRTAVIVRATA